MAKLILFTNYIFPIILLVMIFGNIFSPDMVLSKYFYKCPCDNCKNYKRLFIKIILLLIILSINLLKY